MPLDAYKNFAAATLAAGINSSATSLSVASGQGARFPAVPFNATIYNATDYADAADAYHAGHSEIVRVTAISTDNLTISRAQEGTSAVNLNSAGKTYRIVAGLTARFRDLLPPDAQPIGKYDTTIPVRMRQNFDRLWGFQSNGEGFSYNVYSATLGFGGLNLSPPNNEAKLRPFSGWQENDFNISDFSGSSRLCFATRLYTPSVLSDASSSYDLAFGFFGGGSWLPSQYLLFWYNHGSNGGKWQARSKQSSETTQDTGVTVAASTWYDLRIEANTTNALFYIDNALVATISTNLPNAQVGTQYHHYRNGGANRTSHLKFMEVYFSP
jgi:hypothetical protein